MAKKQQIYRSNLKPLSGERKTFTGKVCDYGVARELDGVYPTLLVRGIKHEEEEVTDHAWIKSQQCDVTEHKIGETIMFSAIVRPYVRGYRDKKFNNGTLVNGYCFDGVIIL